MPICRPFPAREGSFRHSEELHDMIEGNSRLEQEGKIGTSLMGVVTGVLELGFAKL